MLIPDERTKQKFSDMKDRKRDKPKRPKQRVSGEVQCAMDKKVANVEQIDFNSNHIPAINEIGIVDTFTIEAVDLGQVFKIKIRHDNTMASPDWYLEKVEVVDVDLEENYLF
eukprot:g28037.t1